MRPGSLPAVLAGVSPPAGGNAVRLPHRCAVIGRRYRFAAHDRIELI